MFNKKTLFTTVFVVLSFLVCSFALAQVDEPAYPEKPAGFINDQAGILGDTTDLETMLSNFEKETSNEVTVMTIESLGEISIEEYSIKLFEKWGIGKKDKDNGVLLVISKEDREMRIEVGYGLEGSLPDSIAKIIIANEITPSFQDGNYHEGVKKGLEAIISATKGEYIPEATSGDDGKTGMIGFIIFGVIILIIVLSFVFGRKKGRRRPGSGTTTTTTTTTTTDDDNDSFFSGSSGSDSSSSGSSFGGFSGGSSGGGGASGKW